MFWIRADFVNDGTHPSPSGRTKVANLLLDFLKTDSTAIPWFLKKPSTSVGEDFVLNPVFVLYPNPASDYLIVSGLEGEAEIINTLGISLWHGAINSGHSIEVSNLENGIYFLKIKNSIQKFMVVR